MNDRQKPPVAGGCLDGRTPHAQRRPDIERVTTRMGGQHVPWYTITDDFETDFGVEATAALGETRS